MPTRAQAPDPGGWSNWAGTVQCSPTLDSSASSDSLERLIGEAGSKGMSVRAAGAGHSFVPLCASSGLLIRAEQLGRDIEIDTRAQLARVGAGAVIHNLGEPLNAAGLALANQGDIDVQTVAGAISTGTHGTGRRLGNLATQVAGLTLLLASGDRLTITRDKDPELFRAAVLSLGTFGIVLDITLELVPRYSLREQNSLLSFEECCARFPSLQDAARSVEFFWLPEFDRCVVKTLEVTDAPHSDEHEMDPPLAPPGTVARYLRPSRTHWSHRIFPSKRAVLFNELEFAVPLERGIDCLVELRSMIQRSFPDSKWAVEYRTVAADDLLLSQACGYDVACISVHEPIEVPAEPLFRRAQEILLDFGGRPHWGKSHYCEANTLSDLYPGWSEFHRLRRSLDPSGLFLNPYLRRLFGESCQ